MPVGALGSGRVAVPEPSPAAEPDPDATEGSAFGFEPWQDTFAEGSVDLRDHLMLLPHRALTCEGVPSATLEEAGRDALVTAKGGDWMELESEGWTIQLKLFQGPDESMLALNLNCGVGCMCNRQEFRTWSDGWSERTPLDEAGIREGVHKAQGGSDVPWFLELPQDGDEIAIVDASGRRIFGLGWEGATFTPRR